MKILLAAALLSSLSGAARAATATVDHAQGKVFVETAGKKKPAKKGDAIASGAFVETASKASAVVTLEDGTKLKLVEKSRVKVTLPDKTSSLSEALLEAGGVFAKVVKRKAGSEFRVRTASAVAAVRGTEFFTAFGRPASRGRDLWVCVNEGAVEVGTEAGPETMVIKAGQGVLLKSGRDLTKPQAYDWTKKLNWNMDAAKGAVEDRTNLDAAYTDLLNEDYR